MCTMSFRATLDQNASMHLDREEDLVGVARVLVEEPGEELEVARAQVIRVELAAIEEHLHARREGIDPGLDCLKALFVRDDASAAPAVRVSSAGLGKLYWSDRLTSSS